MRRLAVMTLVVLLVAAASAAWAQQRFPPPDFSVPYTPSGIQTPGARPAWAEWLDVALMTAAMGLAAWIGLRYRRRWAMLTVSVASLAYFGFYRAGCICPIGAIQNVAQGLFDPSFYLPATVVAFFAVPLVFSLLFGRVFCSGVCWLGAMQDLVLVRPVSVPHWLDRALRAIPWVYLSASVLLAALGAMYLICEYDPFVPFFRLAGPAAMFITGGIVLLIAMFVGRPYCRFLCPYGALLGLLARVSWKGVTITPAECINCHRCRDACPFAAIEPSNAAAPKEERP